MNAVLSQGLHQLGRLRGWVAGRGQSRHQGGGELPVRAHVDVGGARPVQLMAFDQTLVAVVTALLALGVVMVYSASIAMPDNPKFANYSQAFFLQRHLLALVIAFVAALAAVQVPMSVWEKHAPVVLLI